FFFSSRRRHTRFSRDWSSDVCSSDLRQGLTFARPHFRDLAVVQGDTAQHLHIEMPHTEYALAAFAHNGVSLRQKVVQGRALLQPLTKLNRLGSKLFIAQLGKLRFQFIDLCDLAPILFKYAIVTTAEKRFYQGYHSCVVALPPGSSRRDMWFDGRWNRRKRYSLTQLLCLGSGATNTRADAYFAAPRRPRPRGPRNGSVYAPNVLLRVPAGRAPMRRQALRFHRRIT